MISFIFNFPALLLWLSLEPRPALSSCSSPQAGKVKIFCSLSLSTTANTSPRIPKWPNLKCSLNEDKVQNKPIKRIYIYRFFQVNFLRAPSCPYFLRSLTLTSCVRRPHTFMSSSMFSSTKDRRHIDKAYRIAPAWLAFPPASTVHSTSTKPSNRVNCKGNIT